MSPPDIPSLPSWPDLEQADTRLRQLYATLAEDPDRADELESEIIELRERRRELATRAGLELLAWSRACRDRADADAERTARAEAPPEPAREAEPELAPAPREAVAAVVERLQANGFRTEAQPTEHPATVLGRLVRQIGAPRDLSTMIGAIEELDALDEASSDPDALGWHLLLRDTQRLWVGMLVARARALKAATVLGDAQRERLRSVLQRFPTWSSTHRPGHVHGLALEHTPKTSSWLGDARELWLALSSEALDDGAPWGAPRRDPPRSPASSRGNGHAPSEEEQLPTDWPAWHLTRGKRAAIAGGTPREDARAKLASTFGLSELDWPESANPRRVDALVRRVENGTVDLVILIQNLIDHSAADSLVHACKATGVPFVLSQGYGISGVRAAVEKKVCADHGPTVSDPLAS